jgi:hypothetical protein
LQNSYLNIAEIVPGKRVRHSPSIYKNKQKGRITPNLYKIVSDSCRFIILLSQDPIEVLNNLKKYKSIAPNTTRSGLGSID